MMIDLADCDALLPSVFDIRPNLEFDAENRPYLFNSALLALSVILGRILKMVYSPSMSHCSFPSMREREVSDMGLDSSWHHDSCERRR